jgi:hypothetical protein
MAKKSPNELLFYAENFRLQQSVLDAVSCFCFADLEQQLVRYEVVRRKISSWPAMSVQVRLDFWPDSVELLKKLLDLLDDAFPEPQGFVKRVDHHAEPSRLLSVFAKVVKFQDVSYCARRYLLDGMRAFCRKIFDHGNYNVRKHSRAIAPQISNDFP